MQQINAVLGGKFNLLIDLTDMDAGKLTNTFSTAISSTAISNTATKVLGKCQSKNKPWITNDIIALCDERRKLKKKP